MRFSASAAWLRGGIDAVFVGRASLNVRQRTDTGNSASYDTVRRRWLEARDRAGVGRQFMASEETPSLGPALRFPQWRSEYEAALRETDRRTLFKRVEIAEASLLSQRDALTQHS